MSQRRTETRRSVLLASTAELVAKVKGGDRSAEDEIARRNLPELRRWARGRLPDSLRDRNDTEDLVQETLLRALRRLPELEVPHPGAFQKYLRTALQHQVVDEVRRSARRPSRATLEDAADPSPDQHELVASSERADRYLLALRKLRPLDRALLVARVERGWTYEQIRRAFDKKTANATRVAVTRALQRLARAAEPPAPPPAPRPGPPAAPRAAAAASSTDESSTAARTPRRPRRRTARPATRRGRR